MNAKSIFVRHKLSDIRRSRLSGDDKTLADAPEAEPLGAGFWSGAKIVMPKGKTSIHLRLDSDVANWFKAGGKGHLSRMNAVLRAHMEAHR